MMSFFIKKNMILFFYSSYKIKQSYIISFDVKIK